MNAKQETGAINILLIPLIIVVLLFGGATAFAFWAYSGRQDYKNNVDQKITTAVSQATQQTQQADQAQYNQEEKSPYKNYVGPVAFGSATIVYPKTWSAYVAEQSGGSSTPVNGYFYPGFVPDTNNPNSSYALRIQVVQSSYSQMLSQYTGLINSGKVVASPYSFPKVPSVQGERLDGAVIQNKQGSMIVMPLRNETILLWTESASFTGDFNNIILPNFVFSP